MAWGGTAILIVPHGLSYVYKDLSRPPAAQLSMGTNRIRSRRGKLCGRNLETMRTRVGGKAKLSRGILDVSAVEVHCIPWPQCVVKTGEVLAAPK